MYILQWCGKRPQIYFDDIDNGFKGKIVEKYFSKSTNYKVQTNNGLINISGLRDEFIENIEIGDSVNKIPNTNCCQIIKDSVTIVVPYIFIHESILENSDSLRQIYKTKCK